MTKQEAPEKMKDFFNTRAEIYDRKQIENIDGGRECFHEIVRHIPENSKTLLDLGCGTGLELENIFKKFPKLQVTGIDLADKMLDKLAAKYSEHPITIINANYFDIDLGIRQYDVAISIMSFHHYNHDQKLHLYDKIYHCLKENGIFIECDYMIGTNDAELEAYYLSELKKITDEYKLPEGIYHFDTPFTVNSETSLLHETGFKNITKIWGINNNIMLQSTK